MSKRIDFEGQKMLVFPPKIREILQTNIITKDLYLTDIGYYPTAKNHFRARNKGCQENILILCTNGRGWIELNGSHYTLKENQYFIIPKNTIHKYASENQEPWTIYWIHFAGTEDIRFKEIYGKVHNLSDSQFARHEDRIQMFDELLIVLEEDTSVASVEYASILLTHLLGTLKYVSQFRKIKEVNQKDEIYRSIDFMKNNLNKKIALNELAKISGLSVSHYCLRFKKQTSKAPMDYLIMLKIQRACHLLIFSTHKIKGIAEELGYDDPYYFSRLFSNYIGKSPRQYRKEETGG
ncbi:AraC family transcriptional regulator [Labilibacter marinus]|uniref:AraC family transcriptional regulator n=1 Tax=Labilibacter marinus TaxID=1477105 RepID=UPI00094FC1FA|nr:AraC family transcriptional regulator [Labilibacter marinus]